MKLLVSLSTYGNKNLHLLNNVVETYKSFKKYESTIQVHCTVPVGRNDIKETVHTSPRTTAFFHREDFIKEQDNYDLFIFSEYDMNVTEEMIDLYLEYEKILPIDSCLGFIRYENVPDRLKYLYPSHTNNSKFLIDLWMNVAGYNYIRNKYVSINGKAYFTLSNSFQSFYIFTKEKLKYIIDNSDFELKNNVLGVESSSASMFKDWDSSGNGIIKKVLPLDRNILQKCLVHHMADCHCIMEGVHPEDFSNPNNCVSHTVTTDKLYQDLNI